jgi:hypothetical protein
MRKGGEGVRGKLMTIHQNFIRKFMNDGRPANIVIVLDTHSDTFSGQLQAAGGLTGVSSTLTLPDLVRTYVGNATLQEMGKASVQARTYNTIHEIRPGVVPWADITPKVRGGWRIMVMVSCGSSVRQPVHWDQITQLFTKQVLQLSAFHKLTRFVVTCWIFSLGLVGMKLCLMTFNLSSMAWWRTSLSTACRMSGRQSVIL